MKILDKYNLSLFSKLSFSIIGTIVLVMALNLAFTYHFKKIQLQQTIKTDIHNAAIYLHNILRNV